MDILMVCNPEIQLELRNLYTDDAISLHIQSTAPLHTHTARSTLETGKSRYSGENRSLLARHATPTVGYRTGRRS